MTLIMQSADGRLTVGVLAAELGLRQPTVSHHLKALFDAGLLERRPEGRSVWYSIAPERADRISEILPDAAEQGTADGVLDRISADLTTRFAGVFSAETVERCVRESHALLAEQSGITHHLPSLTSTFAADRLSALASEGVPPLGRTPEILFVCVQNAGRSQLASAILRSLAGDRVRVLTAGSEPAGSINSKILAALDEIGIPVGGEYPKPLTDEVVRAADYVITMGCGDACPIYPGKRYLDWDLSDPAELSMDGVRQVRDDIDGRVRELLTELNSR